MKNCVQLLAVAILALTSCGKAASPEISVTTAPVHFPFTGGTVKASVVCNTVWEASCERGDVMIAPSSYNGDCNVSVTVPPVSGRDASTVKVVFTTGGEGAAKSAEYIIHQAAKPFIDLDIKEKMVAGAGEIFKVQLLCNAEWEMTSAPSEPVTVTPTSGNGDTELTFTVPENPKGRVWQTGAVFSLKDDPSLNVKITVAQRKN